jgi:hypothetical protein
MQRELHKSIRRQIRAFPVGSDFSQSAYDHKDMSLCEKLKPTGKSSNLALEATYATPSSKIVFSCFFVRVQGKTPIQYTSAV